MEASAARVECAWEAMRVAGRREAPELVFRGRVAPWYGALCAAFALAVAILSLQESLPVFVPLAVLAVGLAVLVPAAVRNRVELYADRLEIVCGWSRVSIPYEHVRGVARMEGGAGQFTSHLCAAAPDGVFVEAPRDGDAAVSVVDNEGLMRELALRASLDGGGEGAARRRA